MWEKSRGVYFEGTVHMPSPLRLCVKSLFPCVILHECLTSNFSYTFTVTHRPLCRYDVILEENKELTFRPMPCEESNFWDNSRSTMYRISSGHMMALWINRVRRLTQIATHCQLLVFSGLRVQSILNKCECDDLYLLQEYWNDCV